MNYLSVVELLFLHHRLIVETGGTEGLRDMGLLEAAAARPQATFDGMDLYADVYSKAAALMESLVNNHPFLDGNKRVGIAAAALFLRRNQVRLTASNRELERFTLSVAQGRASVTDISSWLQQHARPL